MSRLAYLAALAIGCGSPSVAPDAAIDAARDADPLVGVGAVTLIHGGYQFVEGPQWRRDQAVLVFSDIPANTIFSYTPGGPAPAVLRMPSGNSNGLAVDPTGGLLAAEHGSRSVTRTVGATTTTLVAMFEGKRLNSPNDVIAAPDGTIYFTDPPFGIQDSQRELAFIGVFRIAAGAVTAERRGALAERPNGIGLSPDGGRLYVDDSSDGNLYRFAIGAGGTLGPRELHAPTAGGADGLAIDAAGNVFVATTAGIEVFAPDATRWGVIAVPEQPANCAFGGADLRTLFITARTSVYEVDLAHPGLPER